MAEQLRLWNDEPVLHNIFFAAKPDPATAKRIAGIAENLANIRRPKAKLIPAERLHMSLVPVGGFFGACPPAAIDAAKAVADTVSITPFMVMFDHVASFGGRIGQRAVVLAGGDGIAGAVAFQETLSLAMIEAGLDARRRSKFEPHVTMMYADPVAAFAIEAVSWTVDAFVLVDSLYGQSTHTVLGRWPR